MAGDKDDSRCLHITIHRPLSASNVNRVPLLSAKFIFDDHIRCMAAKQRLTKVGVEITMEMMMWQKWELHKKNLIIFFSVEVNIRIKITIN